MKKKIKLIYKLSNYIHRCFQTAYQTHTYKYVSTRNASSGLYWEYFPYVLHLMLFWTAPRTTSTYSSFPPTFQSQPFAHLKHIPLPPGPVSLLGSQQVSVCQARNSRSCSATAAAPGCTCMSALGRAGPAFMWGTADTGAVTHLSVPCPVIYIPRAAYGPLWL